MSNDKLTRLALFDDSDELANELDRISNGLGFLDRYYLIEVRDHLRNLYSTSTEIINELFGEIEQLKAENAELKEIIFPKEKSTYLGFTINGMLAHLNEESMIVKLEKANDLSWRLYVFNEELGEAELEGTLLEVLSKACKPFLKKWQQERQDLHTKLYALQQNLGGEA